MVFKIKALWDYILALPIIGCMILGEVLTLSKPLFLSVMGILTVGEDSMR